MHKWLNYYVVEPEYIRPYRILLKHLKHKDIPTLCLENINDFGENDKDYNVEIEGNLSIQCGKINDREKYLLYNYYIASQNYKIINKKLRNGETLKNTEAEQGTVNAVISVCKKNLAFDNFILFRYIDQNYLNQFKISYDNGDIHSISEAVLKFRKSIIKNKIVSVEKAILSTSYNLNINYFKFRDVLLGLYVPKGTHLYATNNEEETEVIFAPGMKLKFFDCFFDKFEGKFRMILKAYLYEK